MANIRDKVRETLDREPVWRKVADNVDSDLHEFRNAPGSVIRGNVPKWKNRNLGAGVGIGIVEAAVAVILEDTVGVPFGAEAGVQNVEMKDNGFLYTVDVNAPTENMAQARAFIDSGTGFTSVLSETLDVKNTEIRKTRMLRDTYRVEIFIEN